MKVVVPHAGQVHPSTRAVCDRWPDIEYHDVSGSDTAYSELIRELWATGEGFAVCEQDIVPHAWSLAELALCPEPYCAALYPWSTCVGPALGLTRFSALFLRCFPDAAEIAARIPSAYGVSGHWRQFDVHLMAAVLRDLYQWQPHCHLPPVAHMNPERQIPPGAPIVTRVESRTHLAPGTVERIAAEVAAEHHPSGKAGYVG